MMRIDQIAPDGSSGETGFNNSWQLISANPGDGLRYRQRFTVALPTTGIAEGLLLAETTGLKLTARNLIFNALDSTAPERAQLSSAGSGGVRLTLPLARIIHSIRFTGAVSAAGENTQLFRVDGDVIAEDPVTSYRNPVPRRAANPGNSGKPTIDAQLRTESAQAGSDAQIHNGAMEAIVTDNGLGGLPGGELGLIDREVILRLSNTDPLLPAHISQIKLSTGPENLRVSVRLPALGDEAIPLPLTFALNQQVNAGQALHAQLSDLVSRLRAKRAEEAVSTMIPVLPDPMLFEFDIESDAPCQFDISGFAIDYQLIRQSFPNGKPKQVLRFTGDGLKRRRLALSLPVATTLVQGEIRINGNPLENAADSTAPAGGKTLGAMQAASDSQGLRTDIRHHWSSPLELESAVLIGGLDLLISPLQTGVQLQLELVGEVDGAPEGERLGLAESSLESPGRAGWQRFRFDKSILLQQARYWLVLSSREGAAVWYTRPAVGGRILRARENRQGAIVDERAGIANWLAADGPVSAHQSVPEINFNGQALSAIAEGRELVYDLLPGMSTVTGPAGSLLLQDLEILSNGSKPLTLYPPRIIFEAVTSG